MAKNQPTKLRVKTQSDLDGKIYPSECFVGKRFGRLLVIAEVPRHRAPNGAAIRKVKCLCDCGNYKEVGLRHLKTGATQSCGCYRKDLVSPAQTHGLSNQGPYTTWSCIKSRCNNKNSTAYKNYGARGITVCDEWQNDFQAFYDWALKNGWEKSLDIDRIDNDKGYSPENCRFVTRSVNAQNTRLIHSTNTSGYRGVSIKNSTHKWVASIRCNGKMHHIGTFNSRIKAAQAYDKKVKELGSEHPLNFPSV